MRPLIENLFTVLLATPERGLTSKTRRTLVAADERAWLRAFELLAPHKVFPLLSHQLSVFGLREQLPPPVRAQITASHDEVRARNTLLLLTLARLLRLGAERSESLLLLKGILFADSYYPEFSTRPMSDIDLVAVRGRDEALFSLLADAGFRPSFHHIVQEHSITFMNREGVFCDAHRSLPMFDSEPFHRVSREIELRRVRGVRALALEPNAMIAHLVVHMHGHARELGFVLLWIVDLALVLRRAGRELDPKRIRKLIGDDAAWALLLRLVRLIEGSGEPLAPGLLRAARAMPPLSIGAALRQRRITPWGLPAPLGWARLFAHQLGLHRSDRPLPRLPDLVLWPLDELTACVAPPLARVSLR